MRGSSCPSSKYRFFGEILVVEPQKMFYPVKAQVKTLFFGDQFHGDYIFLRKAISHRHIVHAWKRKLPNRGPKRWGSDAATPPIIDHCTLAFCSVRLRKR